MKALLTLGVVAAVCLVGSIADSQPAKVANEPLVDQVRTAISKGVKYLETHSGKWEANGPPAHSGGQTALVLLALLNSGVKTDHPDVKKGLEYLRGLRDSSTYVRALQTMVWVEAKQVDLGERIQDNAKHLVNAAVKDSNGNLIGWNYDTRGLGGGKPDNSNSQYALLGVWAAQQNGVNVEAMWADRCEGEIKAGKIPPGAKTKFWTQVRDYYTVTQSVQGGWAYSPFGDGLGARGDTLTMTTAGVCGLLMAQTASTANRDTQDPVAICGIYNEDDAIKRGLAWISPPQVGQDRFSLNPGFGAAFYNIYGLERLGRLSGQRFLGPHDWYREGCAWLVKQQHADGYWSLPQNHDGNPMWSTSFALLFLSKGRTPVLISKLAHGQEPRLQNDLDWNRRRSDLRHLVDYASVNVFKKSVPMTWQNFDMIRQGVRTPEDRREVTAELLQSPIAYLTGHQSPARRLTSVEKAILKEYVENGGFLLAVACCGDRAFTDGFHELCQELWPFNELTDLPSDHGVWNMTPAGFAVRPGSGRLKGIQMACKTVVIFSPENLCGFWEINRHKDSGEGETAFRLGANIVAYATGMEPPQPKLTAKAVSTKATDNPLGKAPLDVLQVGQLISKPGDEADWRPAPEAMSKLMQHMREVAGLDVVLKTASVPINHKDLTDFKFLYMHGRKDFKFVPKDLEKLRLNLQNGGLLLADACCGRSEFDKGFRQFILDLFPKEAFPGGETPHLAKIPADDPLFSKALNGEALTENNIVLRRERGQQSQPMPPQLEGVKIGDRWAVIYSKYDIGCALEKHQSADCVGYSYDSAVKLARAAVLYLYRP